MDYFRTNIPNLFLIGTFTPKYTVLKGLNRGKLFVERASAEGIFVKNDPSTSYQLIIVGAGPAGISAAKEAQKQGIHYLLLEAETVVATIKKYPVDKWFYLDYLGETETNTSDVPFYDAKVDALVALWEQFAKDLNTREREVVEHIASQGEYLLVTTASATYTAQVVLLTIGQEGEPRRLMIPGEILPHVQHRFRDPQLHRGQNILIVGGGNSAAEAALALVGTNNVFLSYRQTEFTRLTTGNAMKLQQLHEEHAIKVFFESEVVSITKNDVILKCAGEEKRFPIDMIYVLIGFEPKIDFLEKIGLDIGYVIKNQRLPIK